MTTYQALLGIAVLGVLASVAMCVQYIRTHPHKWAYMVPPLTWLAHLLIFYGCVIARDAGYVTGIDFTFWSVIVRLQAVFLVLGVITLMAYERLIFRS